MKDESILKTPQLLTRSKHRPNEEIKIEVIEDGPPASQVQSFNGRDVFGWGFPKIDDGEKRKNIIDLNWLNEYNDEIDKLQVVIKKERSLSFNSHLGDLISNPRRSLKLEDESELEASLDSTHSFEIDLPEQSVIQKSSHQKGFVKSDGLSLQVTNGEICSSTPTADILCSIRSCPSRDSGICASDDISENLTEIQMDRSLLAELEGVGEDKEFVSAGVRVSPMTKFSLCLSEEDSQDSETKCEFEDQVGNLPEGLQCKFPAWYKKFSIGQNDFILDFDSLNWGLEPEFEEGMGLLTCGKDEQYDSLISKSDKDSNSDDCVDEVERLDNRRRQSLKDLWSVCDKLEASSLRGGQSVKGMAEIMELVASLSKINSRLEILRCDLQSLSRQATENRHELNSLQKKASNLITSTESSRYHMSQLFCLERLEERLQEEWWGAHYPDLVKLEENYVV